MIINKDTGYEYSKCYQFLGKETAPTLGSFKLFACIK